MRERHDHAIVISQIYALIHEIYRDHGRHGAGMTARIAMEVHFDTKISQDMVDGGFHVFNVTKICPRGQLSCRSYCLQSCHLV